MFLCNSESILFPEEILKESKETGFRLFSIISKPLTVEKAAG